MLIVINAQHTIEEHISWFTKRRNLGSTITLYEVVERRYPHPDSTIPAESGGPMADIVVTEVLFHGEAGILSKTAATWVLLEACQKAVTTANEGGG